MRSDDLISRQAAIEWLAKAMPSLTTPDGSGEFDRDIQITDEAFVDAMQIIHDLPSARPEPQQWIPASERLPEEGKRAILKYSNGKISGGVYIGSRTWDVDFGDTDTAVSVVEWRPE